MTMAQIQQHFYEDTSPGGRSLVTDDIMNQLPNIPQPVSYQIVLSCTGYSTIFVKQQWEELGPTGRCMIEIILPNIINLKQLNSEKVPNNQ